MNPLINFSNVRKIRCVFFGGEAAEKHTLVLFEAAGGGLKKNILFRTRYLITEIKCGCKW